MRPGFVSNFDAVFSLPIANDYPTSRCFAVALAFSLVSASAHAQQVAPATVTPPTLVPQAAQSVFTIDLPETGAVRPPPGSDDLSVTLGTVTVEGAFAKLTAQTATLVAPLNNARVTLRQVYEVASAIEAAHARAGYVLARVTVPPQTLRDGEPLRIVILDGFIEAVDVSKLPVSLQDGVSKRTSALVNQRQLTLADIEAPLVLATEIPGLTLRSTLVRGDQIGGVKLVLEGTQRRLTSSIAFDDQLDASLGRYGVSAQFALNSAFGFGEQIYGFVYSGYDPSQWFDESNPVRVLGGGALLPLGDGRFVINPEVTFSRTRPSPLPRAPETLGELRRYTLRGSVALSRTRQNRGDLNLAIEQIDESNAIPIVDAFVSASRYMTLRVGTAWSWNRPNGATYGLSGQLSQGLGDLGAITLEEAIASGTPFSRQGADTNFSKFSAQAQATYNVGTRGTLNIKVKAQSTFGKPVFRSEQFALEGPDGVSAFIGGATAVDEGIVGRVELALRPAITSSQSGFAISPYIFAANGTGTIAAPTRLEPGQISAGTVGAGIRVGLARIGASFTLEYAHGYSDYEPISDTNRANASLSFRF